MGSEAIHRAARLVLKGLSPRLRPATDLEYRELVAEYMADDAFRGVVHTIAGAFEMRVLDVSPMGIVLAPHPETRFAATVSDYRARLGEVDRGLLALIQVAVAATFFPTAASLEIIDRPGEVSVTVSRIRDNLLALCRRLEQAFTADPKAVPSELRETWRVVLERPIFSPSLDREAGRARRAAPRELDGIIRIVLNNLEDQGMVRSETSRDEPFYLPLRRYKVQLRELAANEVFDFCHRLACETTGGTA